MKLLRNICLLIVLLGCGLAVAQPRLTHPELYLGVQGGAVASMVQFAPAVQQNWKEPLIGPHAGLVFRYSEHKVCALQVELNYMQRGWREQQTNYCRRQDYLSLPFLMHLAVGRRFRGFLNLGPEVSVAVYESATGDAAKVALLHSKKSSVEAQQYAALEKPFEWGLAAGLGCYYRSQRAGTYQLEARFNYSLSSVFGTGKTDYFTAAVPMNLSLNLAYLWELRK